MRIWNSYSCVSCRNRISKKSRISKPGCSCMELVDSSLSPTPIGSFGDRAAAEQAGASALAALPEASKQLGYRPWSGRLRSTHRSIWPIARAGLKMMFRQKLFWLLYVGGLLNFVIFFAGIYL